MEGDAALQAEKATAAVLEDRPLLQIGRFAEEHQQVPVQKPAAREWLVMTCLINVHKKSKKGEETHFKRKKIIKNNPVKQSIF